MVRRLVASCHKNLNPPKVWFINYLDINMFDAMTITSIREKEIPL
jgi:hypothetical protein